MSVIIKAKGASLLPPPSIPSQGASPTNSRVTQVAKRALDLNPQSDKERVVVRDPSHYEKIGPEITAEEGIAKKELMNVTHQLAEEMDLGTIPLIFDAPAKKPAYAKNHSIHLHPFYLLKQEDIERFLIELENPASAFFKAAVNAIEKNDKVALSRMFIEWYNKNYPQQPEQSNSDHATISLAFLFLFSAKENILANTVKFTIAHELAHLSHKLQWNTSKEVQAILISLAFLILAAYILFCAPQFVGLAATAATLSLYYPFQFLCWRISLAKHNQKIEEKRADLQAARTLGPKEARNGGVSTFEYRKAIYGDHESSTHPTYSKRMQYIKEEAERMEFIDCYPNYSSATDEAFIF